MKKPGAIDASAVESEEEQASVARLRKPTFIAVTIIFFLSMVVWPLLTLPAGVFRFGPLHPLPCASQSTRYVVKRAFAALALVADV